MTLDRSRYLIAAVAATAALGLAPAVAHAAPPAPEAPEASEAGAAADGYFYVWEHEKKRGRQASWRGNSADWSDRNMRNRASSAHNRGYAGAYEDVRMYWGKGYTGASYCLPNGGYLLHMTRDFFPRNGTGGGQTLNDNVSSHRWGDYC
ncbi:peptidase inhibitor family I36 protein [Streptomyces chitinivorans]|uniref:Peptidase inhibitor family I36 protein n=1 Tax=Streptomyces chitinivorans TaxID=1257027 RepID=A0ABW7HN26_9ACTN|nr:peptidase inhibitor family I36 protein [Streptomyces chitinivorans]MDH2412144.1 peptidase inhibitor family I36 protein [Streptomyces chitinivorans]